MKANVTQNIPTISSPPEQWVQWHKDLKNYFGKKEANSLFLKAWTIRGNSKANTSDLRTYLKDNGIKISESSWDSVVDLGVGVGDVFGDFMKISKYAGIAMGGIVLIGVGMIVYNIAKNPAQAIGTTIKYAK